MRLQARAAHLDESLVESVTNSIPRRPVVAGNVQALNYSPVVLAATPLSIYMKGVDELKFYQKQ